MYACRGSALSSQNHLREFVYAWICVFVQMCVHLCVCVRADMCACRYACARGCADVVVCVCYLEMTPQYHSESWRAVLLLKVLGTGVSGLAGLGGRAEGERRALG